ncbi:MAG: thioredoxin family protein [Arcticibacter sp.]
MLQPEEYQAFFNQAITYDQYLQDFENSLKSSDANPYTQYLPLNWQRTSRINQQVTLKQTVAAALAQITKPIRWLVIVEHWCGDVSQSLPVIAKMAQAAQGHIDLRLAYRDQNPVLMDAHLTSGTSRSIPMLIQLDAEYRVSGTWGPRPAEAQSLVKKLKADPSTANNYAEELHKWYASNKQQAIQSELVTLLQKA